MWVERSVAAIPYAGAVCARGVVARWGRVVGCGSGMVQCYFFEANQDRYEEFCTYTFLYMYIYIYICFIVLWVSFCKEQG